MRTAETLLLEMRVLDDGLVQARRKDRKPLTEEDKREVDQWADSTGASPLMTCWRYSPARESSPRTSRYLAITAAVQKN
jgi:hypothetical protein